MILLEGEIADAQHYDRHYGNRLWCLPNHPCIRYGTIYYFWNKAVLHVRHLPFVYVRMLDSTKKREVAAAARINHICSINR
jgi:hypothetical protein